ncbi:PREDICTED: uncharacterized protein LOC106126763 isoform X2 [Papilio xuthus]|uniref:Uncharacterized protein LOC106126763 isoform X2 n=1 Tax=Papilio xuthus TaxID=66420 RepID=A0AAJ6ZVL6_PAPXU|nr:PREDICTED: uncharacterized protein LOC106126763 isoform X2 [Papilio xuthus]
MMDEGPYQTYQYLPDGNEDNQFFLVQDDGSFLSLNNSQVQYMTHGQDVKEIVSHVQPCAVYDVSSPQFLIDVNNSSEVISMPDQFILPNGQNIIIANNYLLPAQNTVEEQIVQQNEVIQYHEPEKQIIAEVNNEMEKTTDNCTEITLNDEQFHTLEQKGWILLETNDKVYVLDTLGLHDVTTNALIQKLKSTEGSNECIQEETSLSSQQGNIRLNIGEDGVKLSDDIIEDNDFFLMNPNLDDQYVESMEISSMDTTNEDDNTIKIEMADPKTYKYITQSMINTMQEQNIIQQTQNVDNENVDIKPKNVLKKSKTRNVMFRVSTNIAFKDIPDKIALGETKSGKKLYAKITKMNSIDMPIKKYSPRCIKRVLRNKVNSSDNIKEKKLNSMNMDEEVFAKLVRQAAQQSAEVRCSAQDISSAHTTVMQLLKIPDFKTSVLDRNLIITKVVSMQDEKGASSSGGQPTLVTGRVTIDSGRHCFVHVPDMLDNIMNKTEDYKTELKKEDISDVNLEENYVLHVHVTEMKRADNVLRVSITLNTRKLPTKETFDDNRRKLAGKVFACRNCAEIFNTEDELKQHQQTSCCQNLDVEGDLSIDLDKMVAGYTTVVENGKDKIYHCNQCKMKFIKLHNCLKHLKTHYNSETINDSKDSSQNMTQAGNVQGIHKCKMCPCTFNHQQTLVKHIVNKHIKV